MAEWEEANKDHPNILQLAPSGTDADFAAELKQKIIERYKPLLELLTEAGNRGFSVQVACGKGPLGNYIIQQLTISKVFK